MNIRSIYKVFQYSQQDISLETDLYIAAKQISQELLTCTEIEVSDELDYKNENLEDTKIYLDNQRIVKTPGFEIFAFDVEELAFEKENSFIYMIVERNDSKYRFLIGEDFEIL
ncbi:MAG: hypothetical protein U0L85_08875 [Bacilli bacterium]|nr:hypothetical protein [Bacilli bacterium]